MAANVQGILTGMLIVVWMVYSVADHLVLGDWRIGKKDSKSTYQVVWAVLTITAIINILEGILRFW
ncbi:hypothetical protein [Liquorilactobacillus uvarum]|uniref:hypothetical protein n=1 Tax=Liquorilactobacillus uvarum TaxID=303240 RepID=UPI00070C1026|nr:hypothetical protein [Liquorilactobacillus uvarum]